MATDLLPLHPSFGNEQSTTQQSDLNNDHFGLLDESPLPDIQWDSYRPEEEKDLPSFPFNLDDSSLIPGTSSSQVALPPLNLDHPNSSSSIPTASEFVPDLPLPSSSNNISSPQISNIPFPLPSSSTISDSSSVLYSNPISQSTSNTIRTHFDFCFLSCLSCSTTKKGIPLR